MASKYNPVNWFEIPVKDMKRAKSFYEKVFGWELSLNKVGSSEMAWFPMNDDAPGATGSLIKEESYLLSHQGSMVYFSVEDIDQVLEKVTEQGGKILNSKMSIGEYGFVAHFEDCEGNRVALHSQQ